MTYHETRGRNRNKSIERTCMRIREHLAEGNEIPKAWKVTTRKVTGVRTSWAQRVRVSASYMKMRDELPEYVFSTCDGGVESGRVYEAYISVRKRGE